MSLWKKLAFSFVPVSLLFASVEAVLWLADLEPAIAREDPYVGFAAELPLFVPWTDSEGGQWLRTAKDKRRWFNDQRFPAAKSPATRRVFCLGGSTTYGRPYRDRTSFCGWLRESARLLAPETNWEVINTGGISYASYRVAALVRELSDYSPDLFIIYSGHNEFLEERTYRGLRERPAVVRALDLRLRATRSFTLLLDLAERARAGSRSAEGAGESRDELAAEVKTRLDSSVGPGAYQRDDALAKAVVAHFRINLDRIVTLGRRAGAEIVFVVPADNLSDCAPFKSEVSTAFPDAQRSAMTRLLVGGRSAL